eukprot:UC4_evm8s543
MYSSFSSDILLGVGVGVGVGIGVGIAIASAFPTSITRQDRCDDEISISTKVKGKASYTSMLSYKLDGRSAIVTGGAS